MDIRRIDLTTRSTNGPWRSSLPQRARRALIALGLLAPILGIVVVVLPNPPTRRTANLGFERTSFLAPQREAIRVADAHPKRETIVSPPRPPTSVPLAAAPTPAVAAAPVATPEPSPVQSPAQVNVDSSNAAAWAASAGVACIREHESGDDYGANTGNGYYGAYQDELSTWLAAGGTGLPSDAPPAVQDQINYQIWLSGGWGQWGTASLCGL